jgi:hypothetical protein
MGSDQDDRMDRLEKAFERFVSIVAKFADRQDMFQDHLVRLADHQVIFQDLVESLADGQLKGQGQLNTMVDRQIVSQEQLSTLADRNIVTLDLMKEQADCLRAVERTLAEVVETQKRSDEALNILIRMMDDWIRNNAGK